ncbi:MAG: hypothetical protein J1E29_00050 [Duncaniella sp.]|nr:hypothetical protein [Duncaniella sp.]
MSALPVSDRAFGRLLKDAILLTACHTTIAAILLYAETLSTDGIDLSALDRDAWATMKLRIDTAARRSARARSAAAARKAAARDRPQQKPNTTAGTVGDDDSIPTIVFDNPANPDSPLPDIPIVSEVPEGYGILGKIPGYYILSPKWEG